MMICRSVLDADRRDREHAKPWPLPFAAVAREAREKKSPDGRVQRRG
jgi:hypothetical protein